MRWPTLVTIRQPLTCLVKLSTWMQRTSGLFVALVVSFITPVLQALQAQNSWGEGEMETYWQQIVASGRVTFRIQSEAILLYGQLCDWVPEQADYLPCPARNISSKTYSVKIPGYWAHYVFFASFWNLTSSRSVCKDVKKVLGQYPPILASYLVNVHAQA